MPPPRAVTALRLAIVLAAAASLLVTWPLWQLRTEPPMLPLVALPLPFGSMLLATLAFALWRPLAGALLHAAVLTAAMLADQLREQPQMISLAALLLAVAPVRGGARLGAVHLIALWLWSGLGKLTSPTFWSTGAAWLLALEPGTSSALATTAAALLGLTEIALAALAIAPQTRRLAAWTGALLHGGAFVYLAFLRDTNVAVWPWNLALASAAFVLLGQIQGPLLGDRKLDGPLPRIAALAALVLPLGFHAGFVDAPFAQQVYCMNEPAATWQRADGDLQSQGLVHELGVFVPGVLRIQEAWFHACARPGERLVIEERRPIAKLLRGGDRLLHHRSEDRR